MAIDFDFPEDNVAVSKATMRTNQELLGDRGRVSIFEWIAAKADRDAIRAGTNTDDQTALFATAMEAVHTAGKRNLHFPAGKYYGTLWLSENTDYAPIHVSGVHSETILEAKNNGEFAVVVDNWKFLSESIGFYPELTDLVIHGNLRRKGGICAARRLNMKRLTIYQCLVGLFWTDNYYGEAVDCQWRQNDVGIFLSTTATGQTALNDLVDGDDAAASITLPVVSFATNGHSGNKIFRNCRISGNRIGFGAYGNEYSPRNMIHGGSIESNQVGIAQAAGATVVSSTWLEANATSGTTTVDGWTIQKGDVYVDGASKTADVRDGGRLYIVDEALCSHANVGLNGELHMDAAVSWGSTSPLAVAAGGVARINRLFADRMAIRQTIDRPAPLSNGTGAIWCYATPKNIKTYDGLPFDGDVLISESFEGASLTTSHITWTDGTPTYEATGGIWPSQKCVSIDLVNTDQVTLGLGGRLGDAKNYLLLLAIEASEDCTLRFGNRSGFHFVNNNDDLLLPGGKIVTVVCHGATTSAQAADIPLNFENSVSGSFTLKFSGLQFFAMNNRAEAAELCAQPFFYVNETVA